MRHPVFTTSKLIIPLLENLMGKQGPQDPNTTRVIGAHHNSIKGCAGMRFLCYKGNLDSYWESATTLRKSCMETKLLRTLGPLDLTAIGINGVIGAGIFILPATVAQLLGTAGPIAYLFSGL